MAAALVGTMGAVSTGGAGAAVTPAFDAGAARTAGNLLVCWVSGDNGTAIPSTPAGWTNAGTPIFGNVLSAALFYKVAAGGDAAPTIAAQTGAIWNVRLAEFSGMDSVAPLDKTGSLTSGSGTLALTNSSADTTSGEVVVYAVACGLNGGTQTVASSGNNWTPVDVSNNATATANHYLMGYGFTTSKATADVNTVTYNATADNATGAIASFKLTAPTIPYVPRRMPLGV